MATQKEIVLAQLKKTPLTNIEIQQLVCTTCPHGIIRCLRQDYGYDSIESVEHFKKKKEIIDGKECVKHIRWVEYIWKGAA